MATLLLFLTLSSGSFLVSSLFDKDYVDTLPLTLFSIITIQYVMGLLGVLRSSLTVVLVLALLLYIVSIAAILAKKSFQRFVSAFFSPGFFSYLLLFVLSMLLNNGKLASAWDEFSHWADSVKAMIHIDDFVANPASHSAFRSYVPAMSLFQYFDQSLLRSLSSSYEFVEWRLFSSYQVITFSLFMPLLSKLTWKRSGLLLVGFCAALFVPAAFGTFYSTIYIDIFLGLLAGFMIMCIFLMESHEKLSRITMLVGLFVLTLTKDAGLGLSIFCVLLYAVKECLECKTSNSLSSTHRPSLLQVLLAVFVVFAAKMSWSNIIAAYHAPVAFDGQTNLYQFLRILGGEAQTTHQAAVFREFINRFSLGALPPEWLGRVLNVSLPYVVILSGLLAVPCILLPLNRKHARFAFSVQARFVFVSLLTISMLYLVGMCLAYMYKFSEYEGIRLASFDRYLSILLSLLLYCAWAFLFLSAKKGNIRGGASVVAVGVMLFVLASSSGKVYHFVRGTYIMNSQAIRDKYSYLERLPVSLGSQPKQVYVVSQGDTGYDFWIAKFLLRPHRVSSPMSWSLGAPLYEGDIWTKDIAMEEWRTLLIESYDYVLLFRVDDTFIENYSELYGMPENIWEKTLYRVNTEDEHILSIEARW